MSHQEDNKFEEELRATFRRHTEGLEFSRTMQDKVFATIKQNTHAKTAARQRKSPAGTKAAAFRKWMFGVSSIAACLLVAVYFLKINALPMGHSNEVSRFAANGAVHGLALGKSAAASVSTVTEIPASLAPIESRNVTLSPGITAQAAKQQAGPSGAAGKANTHANFVQLGRQEFTVSTRLYNDSNQPIAGNDLQGMLFILKHDNQLTPSVAADWEYFVNGPKATIPAHSSVPWTFTPNPAPPYTSLKSRSTHLIWMYRTQNPNAASTLYLGTLPVRVSGVRLTVTGEGGGQYKSQFITITAKVTNMGHTPWAIGSALGMLFFERHPGAELLSRQTYKYFDDITPIDGTAAVLQPGQSGTVEFVITGVSGADMRLLPLTILLVARNQIGA